MSPETLLREFEVMADAPNGVQKLRELILQLAVRGKLVPQDPSDEPASVLLERIATERRRLFREGKIRKPKPLEFVEEEAPHDVPRTWRWVRLSSVGEIVGGGTPKTGVASYWSDEGGVPWLTPADLNGLRDKFIGAGRRRITESGLHNSSAQLLPQGTVLFSSRAPIGYVAIAANSLATNQGFKSCVPYVQGMSDYIYRLLQAVAPEVDRNAPGTTFKEVSGKIVGQIPIPIPPLPEQRRIVAKVDELMALCDELESRQQRRTEARARLNRSALHHLTTATDDAEFAAHWQRLEENFHLLYDTPETVAELRQAVRQLAVRGKLVPQDPGDEPASVLLERIAAEKQRLVKDGKIRKPKPLPPVGEDEVPFGVPKGWEWVRFGDIADQRLGKMLDRSKNKGVYYPYLRNTNVQWFHFDLTDVKQMRLQQSELDEYEVVAGDLLLCEGGEPGRGAIWDGKEERMMFQKALHRVRPFGGIAPWYLLYMLKAAADDGTLKQHFTGATIKHLTGQSLTRISIPLPPLPEQRRIVAKVDELMALCDRLEALLTAAREKGTHLAASVVHHLAAA